MGVDPRQSDRDQRPDLRRSRHDRGPGARLLPVLEKDKNVEIVVLDTLGLTYVLRFNWKQPPFNDVRYRRAAALALNQKDFLQAAIGDQRYFKVCKAMFGCGAPLESSPAWTACWSRVSMNRRSS